MASSTYAAACLKATPPHSSAPFASKAHRVDAGVAMAWRLPHAVVPQLVAEYVVGPYTEPDWVVVAVTHTGARAVVVAGGGSSWARATPSRGKGGGGCMLARCCSHAPDGDLSDRSLQAKVATLTDMQRRQHRLSAFLGDPGTEGQLVALLSDVASACPADGLDEPACVTVLKLWLNLFAVTKRPQPFNVFQDASRFLTAAGRYLVLIPLIEALFASWGAHWRRPAAARKDSLMKVSCFIQRLPLAQALTISQFALRNFDHPVAVGDAISDVPPLPAVSPALDIEKGDSKLSLLHWAVKFSREFPELLADTSWSSDDLCLVTAQGFTALHYAVLFDVGALALKQVLTIASKTAVQKTWRQAWLFHDGVRVSPLHLAVMYRRDAIVEQFLDSGWDPSEHMSERERRKSGYKLIM